MIPIFKAEKEAGLEEQIKSTASIAYVTQVQDTKLSQEAVKDFFKSAASSDGDSNFDLFYLNTILVSTGINKNLDAFLKEYIWPARYSPINKQFNLEHDQSKIIGHMTSARAVNDLFELIDETTKIEDLPNKFHILTGAVIYRAWSDDKAQAEIENIIKEIGEGKWFVSMECLFRDFDYAVISPSGEQKVIARTEESAWLTKHLRQYGGTGAYNGYTLGRVLKNITFSGKGLVEQPANPDSIIFNEKVEAFTSSFANLGYINTTRNDQDNLNSNIVKESFIMANENTQDALVKELSDKVDKLTKDNETLAAQVKAHETVASELKVKTDKIVELEASLSSISSAKSELEKNAKLLEDRAVAAEKQVAESKAAEVNRSRTDKLVKLGCKDVAEAKTIVEMFIDKTDEQFDAFAAIVAPKWVVTAVTAPSIVNQSALDDVVVEDNVSLAAGGVNQDVEKTRAAMAAVFAGFVNGESIPDTE